MMLSSSLSRAFLPEELLFVYILSNLFAVHC